MLPSLTVAVSTHGPRAAHIVLPPPEPGVDHLLLVQGADDDPALVAHLIQLCAGRDDVTLDLLPGQGVAASRNAALDRARGEILLFADDDITPAPGAYHALRQTFSRRPDLALLRGLVLDGTGRSRKSVPPHPRALRLWNSAGTGTVELAVRPAALCSAGVSFDENFGAGTPQFLGDEYILIADALRAGLTGEHHPIPLAIHLGDSSGDGWHGPRAARARAAVLARIFGRTAPLIRLAFVLRRWRKFSDRRDLWVFLRG